MDRRAGVSAETEFFQPTMSSSATALVGIYRRRNAEHVRRLVDEARDARWATAWWALDEPDESLAEHTVGTGHGQRLALLNETIARAPVETEWLVVSDDDVVFTRGSLVSLLVVCRRAGFDLAQPARSDDNRTHEFNVAHDITRARSLSRARLTTFVEIGPLFVVSPSWRERIVPFPEERGMGWGLELDWFSLSAQGCRLGVVDAVRVKHLGTPGGDYDFRASAHRVHQELAERGFDGWQDVQRTLGVWRPWQRTPPWIGSVA
jgi:hypothetical protein